MDPFDRLGINLKPSHLSATQAASLDFLERDPALCESLRTSISGYRDIESLIPQTESKLFSGHSFPYYESYKDLEASIHLALQGFYKPAFVSIRSCLELGLLCVYYDRNDDSEAVITDWLHSSDPTPMRRKIIEGLSKIDNVNTLCFRVPVLDAVTKLYQQLSNFVHTGGFVYSGESLNQSNVNAFHAVSLEGLIEVAAITVQDLVILFLCKYPIGLFDIPIWDKFGLNPPIGGLLEYVQVDNLKKAVGMQVLSALEPICHDDRAAQAMAEYIKSLPDLTKEQLETQAINVDKEEIQRNGFIWWRAHSGIASSTNDPELGQYFKDRILKLEKWARDNGLYEKGAPPNGHGEMDEP